MTKGGEGPRMMMGDDTKANNKNPLEILADALFFYRGTKNFAKYFLFPVPFLPRDQKKLSIKTATTALLLGTVFTQNLHQCSW